MAKSKSKSTQIDWPAALRSGPAPSRSGIDPTTIDRWIVVAKGKNHRWNKTTKNHVSDTILKYKGVQAGEVDWRPTETIPEDYYAM